MKILRYLLFASVLFFLSGCGGFGISSLEKVEVPLDEINKYLKQYLPKKTKASFGKMKITSITTLNGDTPNSLSFMLFFNIVTFEIPEGLDGSVTFSSSLRYSPFNRALYPKDLNVTNLSFANQSLIEYVSVKARKGIPQVAKAFLSSREIYKIKKAIRNKRLKRFETTSDGVLILYFE
jgi:hypothetical protein